MGQLAGGAQERCCSSPVVTVSTGKNAGTDIASFLDGNGDGVECGEVASAICMLEPAVVQDEVSTQEGTGYLNVAHRRDDGEVQDMLAPAALEVPAQFEDISYNWGAPSASQQPQTLDEQDRLHICMKAFIQSMLSGVLLQLRLDSGGGSDGGQSIDAVASLCKDLSILLISAGSAQRSVPIRAICSVRPLEDGTDSDKCVDLRLSGRSYVRFDFDAQVQANFFGTCMRLLAKAARRNVSASSATKPRAA